MAAHSAVQYEQGEYVGRKVKELAFGHLITSETAFTPSMSSEWHYHANPHFSHILSGGSKEVRKEGQEIQSAGSGLYYYPGIAHQNINYRPGTRIFNLELGEGFFREFELPLPPAELMSEQHHQLNTRGLVRIMKEHYLNDPESLIGISQLCIALVHPGRQQEKHFPEWVARIKAAMHDNWRAPLSLPQLAQELGLHPVTISRYFARYFGCSAGEYLRRIKIEHALSLIKSNQYPLTDIAYECGFTDQAHFTKTFRHITGLLPKQYRNI
jgi:AraC family transcriptional regulator